MRQANKGERMRKLKNVQSKLMQHNNLANRFMDAGMSKEDASYKAMQIITKAKKRK